jgi:hypothetical protein
LSLHLPLTQLFSSAPCSQTPSVQNHQAILILYQNLVLHFVAFVFNVYWRRWLNICGRFQE